MDPPLTWTWYVPAGCPVCARFALKFAIPWDCVADLKYGFDSQPDELTKFLLAYIVPIVWRMSMSLLH